MITSLTKFMRCLFGSKQPLKIGESSNYKPPMRWITRVVRTCYLYYIDLFWHQVTICTSRSSSQQRGTNSRHKKSAPTYQSYALSVCPLKHGLSIHHYAAQTLAFDRQKALGVTKSMIFDLDYTNAHQPLILSFLLECSQKHADGVAFPSMGTISSKCLISIRQAQKQIKNLLILGYISEVKNPIGVQTRAFAMSEKLKTTPRTTCAPTPAPDARTPAPDAPNKSKIKIKKRFLKIVEKWQDEGGQLGRNWEQRLTLLTDEEIKAIKLDLKTRIDYKMSLFSYLAYKRWIPKQTNDKFNYGVSHQPTSKPSGGVVMTQAHQHFKPTPKGNPAPPPADFANLMKKIGCHV